MKCVIYTTQFCGYCSAAKRLLAMKFKGSVEEVDLSSDHAALKELMAKTGHRTVPQIFIGEKFIGGFNELRTFFESGQYDGIE